MSARVKVKPCPFCGTPDPEIGGNFVQCRECGGESYVESGNDTEVEALRRWNSRASVDRSDQKAVNLALEAAATALDKAAAQIRARKQ